MSYWGDYSSKKQPAPEHGIKVVKPGATWWGQRWLEALQRVLGAGAGRLARGKTYARAGRVHDLTFSGSTVDAAVTGSSPRPYKIRITLQPLSDAEWEKAIAAMAQKAQFAAALLGGEMPREIDEAFGLAGTSIFPRSRRDLRTSCSCPDSGDPCKHVAATHYVLGDALDRDPFLLFELRGRNKLKLFEALRAARGGDAVELRKGPEIATVKLGPIDAESYDRPRESLPVMKFSFDEPVTHVAVLRQLGAPKAWRAGGEAPADQLAELVKGAANRARELAMAEVEPSADPPVLVVKPKRRSPAKK